jgi:hypothetical protein
MPPAQVPAWLLALFAVGAALSAVVGLGYTLLVAFPQLGGPPPATPAPVDAQAVQRLATGLAVGGWVLFLLNTVAIVGLARGRAWGRWVATAACVGWLLTCVAAPVSIVVLVNLWRPKRGVAKLPQG